MIWVRYFVFGEEQWAVVGDTFPLGCKFSEKIVFHDFSPITLILITLFIQPNLVFMKKGVGFQMLQCHGGTTNTCIMW